MQTTDGPSTSAVPASEADPTLVAGPANTPMLPAVPLSVPPDFPDTAVSSMPCAYGQKMLTYLLTLPGKQSSVCKPVLHQSSANIPQLIALAYASGCKSSWSQQSKKGLVMHRSTYCVAQTHSQTSQQQIQSQTTLWQTAPRCQPHQQQQVCQPPDGQAGSTNQPQSTGRPALLPHGSSRIRLPTMHPQPESTDGSSATACFQMSVQLQSQTSSCQTIMKWQLQCHLPMHLPAAQGFGQCLLPLFPILFLCHEADANNTS